MHVSPVVRSATRALRIVAIPLTPPTQRSPAEQKQLTYYHFVTAPEPPAQRQSWAKWATAKADNLWASLGRAPEGTWKRRAFLYGERLVDRLDFEELALKSLDPSLGPTLSHPSGQTMPPTDATHPVPKIPLLFPPSACPSPLPDLTTLLTHREPRHKRGFLIWALVAPLTAPFAIVPIIPNFPFFFCVWRSWSHYSAYKATQYLSSLLAAGALVPTPHPALDAVYISADAQRNPDKATPSAKLPDPLLLTRDAVPQLERALGFAEGDDEDASFAAGVYRALEQAKLRTDKDRPT